MNIIIDVNHPGHVHLFKKFAKIAIDEGHKVLFTAKDKEVTIDLLKAYNLDYKCLGKHRTSKFGKIFSLFYHVFRLFWVALFFRANVFLSHGSVPASWVSFLLRRKYIAFEDTGNMEQIKLYKPFAHAILTTESFKQDYGEIQVRYKGFHEIAYLHPNYFTPDDSIYKFLGIDTNEKFFVLRLVSWGATHDVGHSGLSDKSKEDVINVLSKYGRVFISSEAELPENLKKYQISIPPDKMHDALAYATIFIGEGLTMASESAVLGTPAIACNTVKVETIDEQSYEYELMYQSVDGDEIIKIVEKLLANDNLKSDWKKKSTRMLNDKIDVTAFTYWFVCNFPKSLNIMRQNSGFQEKFKSVVS